ncbi:metal-dependent hydrolase [Halomonas korlensis]|uniref:LexA-binding, inner membrane-associated putative hydrolase n=1 Tax=Halomonas korlensis TaxID=463301 RepID=A0A1I7H0P8_9GAMM|nr:metal-dependent hydrolase [Halomonas korlensis]SFU54288.1 LexA-binding, inner membrane-associated putative hydrolase [Halomonas korlensis]
MADFRTHLSAAVGGGVLLAVVGWQGALWTPGEALTVAGLTTFGGILPDIDADQSHAVRLIFNTLALLAVVTGALLMDTRLEPGMLLMACGGLYIGVRFVVSPMFKRFSVHRGIWHSLLAGVLCALATTAVSYRYLALEPRLAWSQGVAVMVGFCIHLLLDELFSVDLTGARLKRSFGTAFKLFDYRKPLNSLLMLLLAAGLMPWLPAWSQLSELAAQGMALWR